MKNKRKGALGSLIISLAVLMSFRGPAIQNVLKYLTRGTLSWRKLEFLWRSNPAQLIMFLVYVLCALVAVVSFLRLFSPGAVTTGSARPARAERPVRNTPKGNAVRAAARRAGKEQEEAIHCEHKTGSEKYLEQIDGYLRTGLIDRAEYRVLKERYQNLNIPDDYH